MRTFIRSTVYHARIARDERSSRMNAMEADDRGLFITCPKCGQRNRLKYEALKRTFRCGKCQTELHAPGIPVDVKSDLVFDALVSRSALPVLSGKRNRRSLARRKSEHRGSAQSRAAVSRHCYSDNGVVQEWNRSGPASRGDASTCDSKVHRARGRGKLMGK